MIEKTAIILSGGRSSRMQYKNKAFLKMNGKCLIEIILNKVTSFKEILIVTNDPLDYKYLDVKTISDIIPQRGPLSGIHAGLTYAKYRHCFILPCDMPFIQQNVLEYISTLADGFDVAVPSIKGYYQPLCGVYSKNCINPIEYCLKNNVNKVTELYSMVHVREIGEKELQNYGNIKDIFRNINAPYEYDKFCTQSEGR